LCVAPELQKKVISVVNGWPLYLGKHSRSHPTASNLSIFEIAVCPLQLFQLAPAQCVRELGNLLLSACSGSLSNGLFLVRKGKGRNHKALDANFGSKEVNTMQKA
jgi:hypothetical protein